jgi:ferredoxin-type protein NapH
VLLAAATFEPIYCSWLCPFKAVTEFAEIRTVQNVLQTIVFVSLFVGLVVVLPLLTRKRTQCAFFCPFGAFQSLSNKLTVFEVRIDRDRCSDCVACQRDCSIMAIDRASVQKGKVLLSCMKCGACVDRCPKGAAVWHIRGTPLRASAEIARMLFLYPAWGFAVMFGGSIIAGGLSKVLFFLG